MNLRELTLAAVLAGASFAATADDFVWQVTTNANVVSGLLTNGASLSYNAVANAGVDGGFLAVGGDATHHLASLAVTNLAIGDTNTGYLFSTNGWLNTPPSQNIYLNAVAYGGGAFVAAGQTNATLQFSPASGWSQPRNEQVKFHFDAQALAFNASSEIFALATKSFQDAYAPAASWSANNSLVWSQGGNDQQSIVESFHGLTAFGSNSFALCGFNGDIRVSTDNGTNWSLNQQIDLGNPTNLYAIASDGSNVLVAVGDHDALWISTNAGSSAGWVKLSFPLTNATAFTTFYAVTYTGGGDNRFIAVGTGGEAFMATNDASLTQPGSWTPVAGVTNGSWNGVSYAASGPFQGVGMMVGHDGVIAIGGTPPPAPDTNQFYTTYLTNVLSAPFQAEAPLGTNTLAAMATNSYHPAGSTTIDWLKGGNFFTFNSPICQPTNDGLCGFYTNYSAVARDARTGVSSANTVIPFWIIPPAPTNAIPVASATNVLGQPYLPVWVDLLVNDANPPANFIVDWYNNAAGGTLLNNGSENSAGSPVNRFYHTPTEAVTCGVYQEWAQTVATNTYNGFAVTSTNSTPVNLVVIPPAPSNPVGATNCAPWPPSPAGNGVLSVTVYSDAANPPGTLYANWYADSNRLIQVASQTNLYQPTVVTAGTYQYYVEAVDAANPGLKSINLTEVTFVLNPLPVRPTVIGNATNYASAGVPARVSSVLSAGFNSGDNSFVTNGPVVVDWYDAPAGGNLLAAGTGSYTPTNLVTPLDANTPSNYYYYTESRVVYTNPSCDCFCVSTNRSTNTLTIYPLPAASLVIASNDFSALGLIAGANPPYASTNVIANLTSNTVAGFALDTDFRSYSFDGSNVTSAGIGGVVLWVTNHLAFTGVSPWVVTLSDGTVSSNATFTAPADTYVWSEFIATNLPTTNFSFGVLSISNPVSGAFASVSDGVPVQVNPFGALVFGGGGTVCGGQPNDVQITALLFGTPPFKNIVWSDGFTTSSAPTYSLTRDVLTTTNYSYAPVVTAYLITNLTDSKGVNTAASAYLRGSSTVIVDPVAPAPPTPLTATYYTCAEVPVQLSVTPVSGFNVQWYSDAGLNGLLTNGTATYQPAAGTPGLAVTNVYWVALAYVDPLLTNPCVSAAAPIEVVEEPCTNQVSIAPAGPGGQGVVTWSGNYTLQSASNLNPPVIWSPLTNGNFGAGGGYLTNVLQFSNAAPSQMYFRLSATNAP